MPIRHNICPRLLGSQRNLYFSGIQKLNVNQSSSVICFGCCLSLRKILSHSRRSTQLFLGSSNRRFINLEIFLFLCSAFCIAALKFFKWLPTSLKNSWRVMEEAFVISRKSSPMRRRQEPPINAHILAINICKDSKAFGMMLRYKKAYDYQRDPLTLLSRSMGNIDFSVLGTTGGRVGSELAKVASVGDSTEGGTTTTCWSLLQFWTQKQPSFISLENAWFVITINPQFAPEFGCRAFEVEEKEEGKGTSQPKLQVSVIWVVGLWHKSAEA